MEILSNNYLQHHGIKGMRWGVRRRRARSLIGVRRKRSILTDEQQREGAREDAQTYKYQKAGESGWKGMGRAIKAKTVGLVGVRRKRSILTDEQRREGAREDAQTYKYQKAGESGWKGMGRAIKAKTVGADRAAYARAAAKRKKRQ